MDILKRMKNHKNKPQKIEQLLKKRKDFEENIWTEEERRT